MTPALLALLVLGQTSTPTPADAAGAQTSAEKQVKTAAAPPPSVAATASTAAPPKGWQADVGLSFIWLTGNASSIALAGTAAVRRDWQDWALSLKAFGNYGRARAADPSAPEQVTALAVGGLLRGDRSLSGSTTLYVSGGLSTDHPKSVELSEFAEGGTGLTWVQVKTADLEKLLLRTDFALRYQHDTRFQYYPTPEGLPGVELLGPKAALAFRYAFSSKAIFTEDAEASTSLLSSSLGRVVLQSITKLSSPLAKATSLTLTFQVNYDSQPAVGKVPTDTALTVGVQVAL